jgi:anaerobic selenocysteine-containing dehydrogenase
MNQVAQLLERMRSGQVKTLFIHGVNPVFELPAALGFEQALQQVPLVVSFSPYPDETAMLSDFVLPDHTPLESWGYMRDLAGSDRTTYSAVQPVVAPLYNTRATVDVLLEAARQAGAAAVAYSDEVDFVQQKIQALMSAGGSFTAPEILSFWTQWLQNGGWWKQDTDLTTPTADDLLGQAMNIPLPTTLAADELYLLAYAGKWGSGATANRPWMQETPDPQTTVMWNTVVQINPETAAKLGVHNDDIVTITSPAGAVEAVVYEYPAIRPDMVAIPFGQGHTALGRWAEGRGVNPAKLLGADLNQAGDLAYYGGTRVKITATGRRRPVSRMESIAGVYGHE